MRREMNPFHRACRNGLALGALLAVTTAVVSPVAAQEADTGSSAGAPAPVNQPRQKLAQKGEAADPSVALPPANQDISVDDYDQRLNTLTQDIDKRLDQLSSGLASEGGDADAGAVLPNADPSSYRGDLDEWAALVRHNRLLKLKLQQADTLTKLYGTLYPEGASTESSSSAGVGGTGSSGNTDIPDSSTLLKGNGPRLLTKTGDRGLFANSQGQIFSASVGQDGAPVESTKELLHFDAETAPSDGAKTETPSRSSSAKPVRGASFEPPQAARQGPAQPGGEAAAQAPVGFSGPLPVVASIRGVGGSYRATLLIPYVGEVDVRVGSPLPGGLKVRAIHVDGVTVDTPAGPSPLPFGYRVPSKPLGGGASAQSDAQPASNSHGFPTGS